MSIDRATPLGEIKGYYRTTLIAALTLYSGALDKTRKAEEAVSGETAHLDDKEEIVTELRAALGASQAENVANTPLGRAIIEGEHKHDDKHDAAAPTPTPEQPELAPTEPDRFAPVGDVDLNDNAVLRLMLELAGFDSFMLDMYADAIARWSADERLAVYRWSKAVQLAGIEGSGVTREDVPALPPVIETAAILEQPTILDRLPVRFAQRLKTYPFLKDALDTHAINWPVILNELGIMDVSAGDVEAIRKRLGEPTVERMLDSIDAGPYTVVEDSLGFRLGGGPSDGKEIVAAFIDRVGAYAHAFVLNVREQERLDGLAENDITKAKRKRGAKKTAASATTTSAPKPKGGGKGKRK